LVVDLGIEADGGYDRAGGGAALDAEASGVVAVNEGVVGDFVFTDDFLGAEPAEVVIVDEFAVGVMADRAFAGMSSAAGTLSPPFQDHTESSLDKRERRARLARDDDTRTSRK
jgi:hypothetical protein